MRRIHLTDQEQALMLSEITNTLATTRLPDEGLNFKYKPKDIPCPYPVNLIFFPSAWVKMTTLVQNCDTECAWHGTVFISEDRRTFQIKDILTYPQVVTAATVDIDEEQYEVWHQSLDDNTYNSLRMQGHSHVNMGVTPSKTDTTMYNDFLQTLSNDSFYVFIVANKKGDFWVNIYDIKENAIYTKNDITMSVALVGEPAAWYNTQKANFKKRATSTAITSFDKRGSRVKSTSFADSDLYDGGSFDSYAEYENYQRFFDDQQQVSEDPKIVNSYLNRKGGKK